MKLKPCLVPLVLVRMDESQLSLFSFPPETVTLLHWEVDDLNSQVLLCSLSSRTNPPNEYSPVWSTLVKKAPVPVHWESAGAATERKTLLGIAVSTGIRGNKTKPV